MDGVCYPHVRPELLPTPGTRTQRSLSTDVSGEGSVPNGFEVTYQEMLVHWPHPVSVHRVKVSYPAIDLKSHFVEPVFHSFAIKIFITIDPAVNRLLQRFMLAGRSGR
jgi:hypothetical protein